MGLSLLYLDEYRWLQTVVAVKYHKISYDLLLFAEITILGRHHSGISKHWKLRWNLVQANNKEIIQALHYWPLWGESTGTSEAFAMITQMIINP